MKKTNLLLMGLLLMGVSAIAQPVYTPQDAKIVFMQSFEADWDEWTSTTVETIEQVAYYNRLGNSSGNNMDIYNGSSDWDIFGYRDTILDVKNGVLVTDGDPRTIPFDSYTIVMDQSAERAQEFAQFGEDGGSHYFQYLSAEPVLRSDDAPWGITVQTYGGSEYSNGVTANYRRNLFVRGLDIEDNSSYRLTFYVKAQKYGSTNPVLYADVMRGYFSSEKPFSMANSTNSFEYKKTDFTGDWEKVTFMTYYTNDSIADGYMYKNGYWWASGQWTWVVDDVEHNYIKQPDVYFARLSFASDSTLFGLDNLSLTKSTIAGVEYYQDKIRVDFGYQTNLGILAQNAYETNHIAAVEVPGEYFEVWGENSKGEWYEVPIRSAEYHGDGYMYMFTDTYVLGGKEYPFLFDSYEKVLVTFHNPVDNSELCLKYTGTLYPNSTDEEWIAQGKPVLDFYNEEATVNPYVFDDVYSLKELPPVMQKPPFEDGSFGLDPTIREMSFQFSRELIYENITATVGDEVWLTSWNAETSSLVITRPLQYTSYLDDDLQVNLTNIQGIGTGFGEDVTLNYHFGDFDRYPETLTVFQSDYWGYSIENQSLPLGSAIWNGKDRFTIGDGYSQATKSRLYWTNPEFGPSSGFYVSGRSEGTDDGHMAYGLDPKNPISLEAGLYAISFSAVQWDKACETSVYIYPRPSVADDYATIQSMSIEDKTLIGTFTPQVTATSSMIQIYSEPYGQWPDGAESFIFQFSVPESGNYVIEWVVSKNGTNGTLLGDFTVNSAGDLSFVPVTGLNDAVNAAIDIAIQADYNSSIYGGQDLNSLVEAINYYLEEFTSTAPSDWAVAKENVEALSKSMKTRMAQVDNYLEYMSEVQSTIREIDRRYTNLQEFVDLRNLYAGYSKYDVTEVTADDMSVILIAMNDAVETLEERMILNDKYWEVLSKGRDLESVGEYPSYQEFIDMCNALDLYESFDEYSATYSELEAAYNDLVSIVAAYEFKPGAIHALTERIKSLYSVSQDIGVSFPSDLNMFDRVYGAETDDDVIADYLKAAIKVKLYEKICAGYYLDETDLTPFIKNYNLYVTPKIVERMDLQMPANASSLSIADPDSAQIQHTRHQYNENGQMPIWIMILGQQYTDLVPGWSIEAVNTGNGNRMVTVDDEDYYHFKYGAPVFDGMLGLDWNSRATLSTELSDLPVGYYSIGVEIAEMSSSAYLTAETPDETYSSQTSYDGNFSISDVYVGEEYNVALNLELRSGNGWSKADNFFLYYTPDDYYDYSAALSDARTELNEALTALYAVPGPIVEPVNPLDSAIIALNSAIAKANRTLASARDYIYGGADYNSLAAIVQTAKQFESEYAAEYYSMADSLYFYSRVLSTRMNYVDGFMYELSYASEVLMENESYSELVEYQILDSLYNKASGLDCTVLLNSDLYSYTDGLDESIDDLYYAIEIAENGEHVMYFADIEAEAGSEFVIPIKLRNSDPITAFSLKVELPGGISVVGAELTQRAGNHQLSYTTTEQYSWYTDYNVVSMACISYNNDTLKGSDGAIVNLTVYADEDMSGEYEIGIYDIEMTESPTRSFYQEGYWGNVNIAEYTEPGDVNMDGYVSITDAVGVVAFIIKSDVSDLNERAADANLDGKIDVADVVWIVNRIIGRSYGAPGRGVVRTLTSDLVIDDIEAGERMSLPVRLEGMMDEITAVQFDLTLPEGIRVESAQTDNKHMVMTGKQEDGKLRVVSMSLSNSTFAGNGEAAVTLELVADRDFEGGAIQLDASKMVAPDGRQKDGESMQIMLGDAPTTNVLDIDADGAADLYDLQGRKGDNAAGILIRGGIKVLRAK